MLPPAAEGIPAVTLKAEAQRVVRSLTQTFYQWEKDPVDYEQARTGLAAFILSGSQ